MKTLRLGIMPIFLASLVVSSGAAQRRTLAGRVTDARTGQPVSNGTVKVLGTGVRDVLRPDGVFVLDVGTHDVTLLVEGEGYRSREIYVAAMQEAVLVELRSLAYALEDATVIGDADGGADGEVALAGRELDRVPASTFEQQLGGRLGGLEVQRNSGAPGDISLRLRGISTLLGPSQPLYVVDGVVIRSTAASSGSSLITGGQEVASSRLADLNPRDIESVRVLRGSAATARYGSCGANGVVVIRTRRGR